MSETLADVAIPPQFPDHTQLPESDGTFVKNFQEHPQTIISQTQLLKFCNAYIQMDSIALVKIVVFTGERLNHQKKEQQHRTGFMSLVYHQG
jgi:hypothetical protein